MQQGEKLKILYTEKGLTQREFAVDIKESLSQINKIVNGHRNVSAEFLQKLITYFQDLDLNWFLKEDVTIRNMVNEEGDSYEKQLNPMQLLDNMQAEIKALRGFLPQK